MLQEQKQSLLSGKIKFPRSQLPKYEEKQIARSK